MRVNCMSVWLWRHICVYNWLLNMTSQYGDTTITRYGQRRFSKALYWLLWRHLFNCNPMTVLSHCTGLRDHVRLILGRMGYNIQIDDEGTQWVVGPEDSVGWLWMVTLYEAAGQVQGHHPESTNWIRRSTTHWIPEAFICIIICGSARF